MFSVRQGQDDLMTSRVSISILLCALAGVALIAVGLSPVRIEAEQPDPAASIPFAHVIPDDVFHFVGERTQPERKFVRQYWAKVRKSVIESGLGTEFVQIASGLFGDVPLGELAHFREELDQLLLGVNWAEVGSVESAYAQRITPPKDGYGESYMFLPDMVLILRGPTDSASKQFDGMSAILSALGSKIGREHGSVKVDLIKTNEDHRIASLNLFGGITEAPRLSLNIAHWDSVVVVAMGDGLFGEVLGLLSGGTAKNSLLSNTRFRSAFESSANSKDSVTYFDMQALVRPLESYLTSLFDVATAPEDYFRNSKMSFAGGKLNAAAMSAYQGKRYEVALRLIEEAYELDPESSIVLYNLACFHARNGHRDVALDWLDKAVEGGVYAPRKIATDSDLNSLRSDARYRVALENSTRLAREMSAADIVINSDKTGEGYRLTLEAWGLYRQGEYEPALRAIEQAYAVAPDDSRVLYDSACYHALLGHGEKALGFLAKAVDGGFYCPDHIKSDDDLSTIRDDARFAAIHERARQKSIEMTAQHGSGRTRLVRRLLDQTMESAGIIDYVATSEHTVGATVFQNKTTALVADAESRAIYPILAKNQSTSSFDRFLPVETEAYSVSRTIDTVALFRLIRNVVLSMGPTGKEIVAAWQKGQDFLGLELGPEIFAWIGGSFTHLTLADAKGSVWLVEVSDEEAARAGLAATQNFLTETLPVLLRKAVMETPAMAGLLGLGIRVTPSTHEKLEGFLSASLAVSPQALTIGIAEGHLILGTSAESIVLCLETARGEHPNVHENKTLASEALFPEGPFSSVTYKDKRGFGEEMATGLGVVSMVGGMMAAMVPDPQVKPVLTKLTSLMSRIAPVVREIDFYRSVATRTTFDGHVWRSERVTHYEPPPVVESPTD